MQHAKLEDYINPNPSRYDYAADEAQAADVKEGARYYFFADDYPCVGCECHYSCDSAYTDEAEFCPLGKS